MPSGWTIFTNHRLKNVRSKHVPGQSVRTGTTLSLIPLNRLECADDKFRDRFLWGRRPMLAAVAARLPKQRDNVWIDLGGGTGVRFLPLRCRALHQDGMAFSLLRVCGAGKCAHDGGVYRFEPLQGHLRR